MNTKLVIEQAEAEIAVAKLANAMKSAAEVEIRFPPSDTARVSMTREVAFVFENEATARSFFELARQAAGKLIS